MKKEGTRKNQEAVNSADTINHFEEVEEMENKQVMTREDRMRGPYIKFNPKDGMTMDDLLNAIDLRVIPPCVMAYYELTDLIEERIGLDERENEKIDAYFAILRNTIALLCRITEEAQADSARRYNTEGSDLSEKSKVDAA